MRTSRLVCVAYASLFFVVLFTSTTQAARHKAIPVHIQAPLSPSHAPPTFSPMEEDALAPYVTPDPEPRFLAASFAEESSTATAASVLEPAPSTITGCTACRYFVKELATNAFRLGVVHEQLIISAQTICAQSNLGYLLGVQCNVYNDMRAWLTRANLISGGTVDYKALAEMPNPACEAAQLCGVLNVNFTDVAYVPPDIDHLGAFVARIKLAPEILSIQRPSPRWSQFVSSFLGAVAQLLKIPPLRLRLHQQQGDSFAEVVIMRGQPTPESLSHLLRALLSPLSNAKAVIPDFLLTSVDRSVQLDVFPLVVPPVVAAPPPKVIAPVGRNETDCRLLKTQALSKCGNSFKCSKACETSFQQYFTTCLAFEVEADVKERVYRTYREFFQVCRVCKGSRAVNVRRTCRLSSFSSQLPLTCSIQCSDVYRPFYDECLAQRTDSLTDAEKDALYKYYVTCQSCTQQRQTAVNNICGVAGEGANIKYPAACSTNCSTFFTQFFPACYNELDGLPLGSKVFQDECVVTRNGGVYFRLKLNQDFTFIQYPLEYQREFAQQLARVLAIPSWRINITLMDTWKRASAMAMNDDNTLSGAAPASVQQVLNNYIAFDVVVRSSDEPLDPSPRAIVDNLRRMLAFPHTALFSQNITQYLDSSFGLKTLVAGQHLYDLQQEPSSLDLAKQELQKAREAGANQDRVEQLEAIVEYHTNVLNGAPLDLLTALMAKIAFKTAVLKGERAEMQMAQAYYEWKYDAFKKASQKQLAADEALYNYTVSVFKEASPVVQQRDYAIWKWLRAIHLQRPLAKIKLLRANVTLLNDTVNGAKPEVLKLDQARVIKWQHIVLNASQLVRNADAAVYAYYQLLAQPNPPKAEVDKAEALVEYTKALERNAFKELIDQQKAILDYYTAVANGTSPTQLFALQAQIISLHKLVVEIQTRAANTNTTTPAHASSSDLTTIVSSTITNLSTPPTSTTTTTTTTPTTSPPKNVTTA